MQPNVHAWSLQDVIWNSGEYYDRYKSGPAHLTWVVLCGVLLLAAFAFLAVALYDMRVRAQLRSKIAGNTDS